MPPRPPRRAKPHLPPVELSPFEVVAEGDVSYQAANTTSGSRVNSRLKDTPASVSAFTPEFLSDIAATNPEEKRAHAMNVEIDVEDSNAGSGLTVMRFVGVEVNSAGSTAEQVSG